MQPRNLLERAVTNRYTSRVLLTMLVLTALTLAADPAAAGCQDPTLPPHDKIDCL